MFGCMGQYMQTVESRWIILRRPSYDLQFAGPEKALAHKKVDFFPQKSIHPLIFHSLNLEDKTTAAKVIGLDALAGAEVAKNIIYFIV
jgi:hypothetical protein